MSNSLPRRRAGRPSTPILSRASIIDASFAVAEQRGGDFSISAVARHLGVQAPAIYNYFANKVDVIAGMRGAITERIDVTVFANKPWWEAVIPWAEQYREAMGQHPELIATLATIPVDSEPESIRDYEVIAEAFLREGYPEELIVPALVSIESFIIGSALDAVTPEDNMSPTKHPEAAPALFRTEKIARESAQKLGTVMSQHVFRMGLWALVEGLKRLPERVDRS